MTIKRIRRPILMLCRDCVRGWIATATGPTRCETCNGSGQIERWIVEVVHVDDADAQREDAIAALVAQLPLDARGQAQVMDAARHLLALDADADGADALRDGREGGNGGVYQPDV